MLTSACQKGDAARRRDLGIQGYLAKPFKSSELRGIVEKLVRSIARADEAPKQESRLPDIEPRPDAAVPQGRKLRILVAEDNQVNQVLARRLLELQGHHVWVCGSGIEAIELWEREDVDLVLMDVQMPDMDGFVATAEIRSREDRAGDGSHTPIVAVTAHAFNSDHERCLAAGMDDYIGKPIRASDLTNAIARVCTLRSFALATQAERFNASMGKVSSL